MIFDPSELKKSARELPRPYYCCRTYEKAVSVGGEMEKGEHVLKDTLAAACAFESGHLILLSVLRIYESESTYDIGMFIAAA